MQNGKTLWRIEDCLFNLLSLGNVAEGDLSFDSSGSLQKKVWTGGSTTIAHYRGGGTATKSPG